MAARLVMPVALVVGAALALPAGAAPKPIEKSFDVSIPVPLAGATSSPTAPVSCSGAVPLLPMSVQVESFTAPAAGTLKVEVTGFMGDWDLALDSGGKRLAEGDNASVTPTSMSTGSIVEKLTYKVKKPGKLDIQVCNFLGGPTGKGKYTFTFAK
jgi:hypothetical protein